jgi:glycosyltransferase involved in cell wall biosynthesis
MVLGTALRPLGFARSRGAVTIGEPVMSHPRTLEGILSQEYDLLGIPKPPEWVNKDRIEEEMGQCDYLVSGSRFIRDSFVANGFPADRIFLNPIPIDTSRFTPLTESERGAVSDGKFRIICVAQIVPRKGVHYLLEAWKRLGLPASKAELLLIGQISPEMRPILDRYYGVFEHISAVPYDRLRLHFGRSSAFVIPSVEDGNAYVTGEAMGCGLPVIVTSNCGSADLVEDGVNGFVVPARSVEQLQKRLEQLYKDPALARSMGERNLELSRANFGVSACVDRFMNIYLEALSRGRR